MSKVRTIAHLQELLDQGFSWRLKEIAYIKSAIRQSTQTAQKAVLRAGVPLVYAHWEGFIKEASQAYLGYVASQRLKYGELASCFVVFGAKKHVASLIQARQSALNIAAVEFFRHCATERADLALSNAVNTDSNLSSTVFANIALSVGIPIGPYEAYANLIDKALIERRNKIAHGEYLDIDFVGFSSVVDEVLMLLRMYKTDIENLASTGAFRATP